MVGILLISHGQLGQCLAECAQHVLGRIPDNLVVMGVEKQDSPESRLHEARELVSQLDDGSGVLVLSDMLGGTPCNIASRLIHRGRVEVVAGVNLPMLVRALCYSAQTLDIVVSKAITGGLEGVYYVLPEEK